MSFFDLIFHSSGNASFHKHKACSDDWHIRSCHSTFYASIYDQFMESWSSYLFHRASFAPMDPTPKFWSVDQKWLSCYLRTVTSCCEIHSLPLLLHYAISYISTIRGDIWRYRQRWVFFSILRGCLWTREKCSQWVERHALGFTGSIFERKRYLGF